MNRLGDAYFDRVYAASADPWGSDSRWYEARKYALTLAALPRERYARAFEPGCANGALTALLAARCDQLIALELVPAVAARARARVAALRHVEVRTGALPEAWPTPSAGGFDLIVLSEVAYYLTAAGFDELLAHIDASLADRGHVIAVHYTGETDYPLSGAAVQARLDAHFSMRLVSHTDESFGLAVYERGVR